MRRRDLLGGLALSTAMALPRATAAQVETRGAGPAGEPTVTDRLADFTRQARFEDLPPDVVLKAKAQIVYLLGLAFRGHANEEMKSVRQAFQGYRARKGGTLIGEPYRLALADAGFANAVMMRADFLDDVLFPAGIHPGIVTLPAALACGEHLRSSGREVLLAIVLGYEVLGKLGRAAYGWGAARPRRPTMIFGGFGPVTVAGRLVGLDAGQLANAYGYAANLCSGVPEGGQTDHFYGFFTRNGMLATELARAGAAPYSRRNIEGELGLYRSFFAQVPPALPEMIASLGDDWEIRRAEYKHHYGTGANTIPIELTLDLLRRERIDRADVVQLQVTMSSKREGRKENAYAGPFTSGGQAYSSLPFALAQLLMHGEVAAEQYAEDAVRSPEVQKVIDERIRVRYADGLADRDYRVEARTRGGRTVSAELDRFMFPFPESGWREWLGRDGDALLGAARVEALLEQVRGLERLTDVAHLTTNLRPAAERAARP